jgi:hypothetical protein
MSNSSPSITLPPSTQNIILTIDGVEVFNSSTDMKSNETTDTTDYIKPITEQDPPNNVLIKDKKYKIKNKDNKYKKLGNYNGSKIIHDRDVDFQNRSLSSLILYFNDKIILKISYNYSIHMSPSEREKDLYTDSKYLDFLKQIYFCNKKEDSTLDYYNPQFDNLQGGNLSRKNHKKNKTIKKSKKNSKSKKTKYNRNKK